MQAFFVVAVVFTLVATSSAETTEGFQKTIRPIAEHCKETVKGTDEDVETAVHLKRDVTPVGKCLMACVMEAIGMMRNGTMASEEEILKPYRAVFADDPRRLSKGEEVVKNCRVEALQKFPTQTCDMAHLAVFCTLANT
ncbi:hypothetical protein R5R35_010832 [Gryllus longicercus]|uniref:Odorant binding protein n=1 Tax=Gryllus longicercus TaxID=2509291 RepID=A0AAN9VU44_9ORTH